MGLDLRLGDRQRTEAASIEPGGRGFGAGDRGGGRGFAGGSGGGRLGIVKVGELVLEEADAGVPVPHMAAHRQEAEQDVSLAQLAPVQRRVAG